VKFQADSNGVGQAASFQAPPERWTTITRYRSSGPTRSRDRFGRRGAGVTVSADLRAPSIASRSTRGGRSAKARSGPADTRQEQAQLAAAEAQKELARLSFERMQGAVERERRVAVRSSIAQRRPSVRAMRAVGEIRAAIDPQNDPRPVFRHPRHPARETGSVPVGRRRARHPCSR